MLVVPVDVSRRESMVATAGLVRSELGAIDLAIMNAGHVGTDGRDGVGLRAPSAATSTPT